MTMVTTITHSNDFNELWFSRISVWEILLLAEKGRISLESDNVKSVREIFYTIPLKEAPINLEVAVQSRFVNLPHQDPADRSRSLKIRKSGYMRFSRPLLIYPNTEFQNNPGRCCD